MLNNSKFYFIYSLKKWRFIRTCNAREIKKAVSIAKLPRTWRHRPFPKMSAGTRNSGGKESCLFLNRRKRMGTLRKNSSLAKLPILDKDWQWDREHWSILTIYKYMCKYPNKHNRIDASYIFLDCLNVRKHLNIIYNINDLRTKHDFFNR